MPHSPGHILLDAVKAPLGAVLADIGEIKGEGPHFCRSVGPGDGDVLLGTGGGWEHWSLTAPQSSLLLQPPCSEAFCNREILLCYCTERLEENLSYPHCVQGEGKENRGKEQLEMDGYGRTVPQKEPTTTLL